MAERVTQELFCAKSVLIMPHCQDRQKILNRVLLQLEVDPAEKEDPRKRQVLVLGLDGAGKSSVLQGLTPGGAKRGRCRPTRGFNFISLSAPACQLDFVLVYVVDSSDRGRLPLAKLELHRLLRVQPQLPVVVLGNKQDKPDAVSVSELHEALSLGSVVEDRKLFLLAAQLGSDSALRNSCRGLDTFQDLLLQLV